ncbi:tetratricopeptide repeat protein [Patescibacteria group bacterium]
MKNKYLPFLLISVIGFALYAQTLSFGIVNLDDSRYVIDNYSFNKEFSSIAQAFKENVNYPSGFSIYYRPIQAISHIIDAHISGMSPWSYHLTNTILHIINSCLVFILLLALKQKRDAALLFSLIFTAHPILVGAIAWIPGRIDTLLALFALSSLIFLIKYIETKKWKFYSLHILMFAGALFTKELAIVLPFFYIFLLLMRRERLMNYQKITPPIAWISVLAIWYFMSEAAVGSLGSLPISKIIKMIFANFEAVLLYLGKMLVPLNLSVLPVLQDSTIIYGIITLIIISTGLFFSKNKEWHLILFGISWFLIFLIPSFYTDDPSSISIFMEHRAYIPLIGFMIVLMEIDIIKKFELKEKKHLIPAIIILLAFSIFSIQHSLNYKNRMAFWQNAAASSPSLPKVHNGLGISYFVQGLIPQAETEYKKAIALNPNEWLVHGNLGLLYMQTGRFQKAEEEYKKEIENKPTNTGALLNLGVLYYGHMQEFGKAKEVWEKILKINPNITDAYEYLAIYYYQQENNIEQSIYHINEIIKRGVMPQEGLMEIYREYNGIN